ncbi:hypothetical protein [Streptomyces sp. NPDC054987]
MVFPAITAVVSLIGAHSARAPLIKDSGVTGLFGLLCLATLLAPRPLMFSFGRKFATDGTPESTAWWNGLWQYEGFRRSAAWVGGPPCTASARRPRASGGPPRPRPRPTRRPGPADASTA